MNMVEKIAIRGGVKHVAGLLGRAIKGKKYVPHYVEGAKKFQKPSALGVGSLVPVSRRKALAKALKATKREAKKVVRGRGPELAGAAVGLGAAVPAAYAISKLMKKKEGK